MKQRNFSSLIIMIVLAAGLAACGGENTATPAGSAQPTTAGAGTTTRAASTTAAAAATTTTAASLTTAAATTAPTAAANFPGKLVFATADNQIFMINPDGSGRKKITDGSSPLLSPDGQRVAFVTTEGGQPGGKATIHSVNLDGGDKQTLCAASPNLVIALASWSPRNKFIAVRGARANSDDLGGIHLCEIAPKKFNEALKTTQGQAVFLYDWAPNGESALWQAGKDTYAIYHGDPDKGGAGANKLTNGQHISGAVGNIKLYEQALIAPDDKTIVVAGSKVFFLSVPGQKSPLDGKVLDSIQTPGRVAWSPDGKAVAVIERTGPTNTLKLVDLATDKVSVLAENVGNGLDWSK